jgi:hypothetical protein
MEQPHSISWGEADAAIGARRDIADSDVEALRRVLGKAREGLGDSPVNGNVLLVTAYTAHIIKVEVGAPIAHEYRDAEIKQPQPPWAASYTAAVLAHLQAKYWSLQSVAESMGKQNKNLNAIVERLGTIADNSNIPLRRCESCGWIDYRDEIQVCHSGSGYLICARCECTCSEDDEGDDNEGDDNEGDENEGDESTPGPDMAKMAERHVNGTCGCISREGPCMAAYVLSQDAEENEGDDSPHANETCE